MKRLAQSGLLLILGAAVVALSSGAAQGAVNISPAYVELSLTQGRPAGQFVISNLGDQEERYRIKSVHFLFLKDGGLRQIEPDNHSMATWIRFSPTEFALAPKTRRVVRFVIMPRADLPRGEYWCGMELESLKTSSSSGKDAAGHEFAIEIVPTVLVPLFGTVGDVKYKGQVKSVTLVQQKGKGMSLETVVANTGEGRLLVDGTFEVINAAGAVIGTGPAGKSYVLPEGERLFAAPLKLDLPEGRYTIRTKFLVTQLKDPLVYDIQVDWKPLPVQPDEKVDEPKKAAKVEPAANSDAPAQKETPVVPSSAAKAPPPQGTKT